jgi:hypothetical protein
VRALLCVRRRALPSRPMPTKSLAHLLQYRAGMTALESALTIPGVAVCGPLIGLGLGLAVLTVLWCVVEGTRALVTAFTTLNRPQPASLRLGAGGKPPKRDNDSRRQDEKRSDLRRAA